MMLNDKTPRRKQGRQPQQIQKQRSLSLILIVAAAALVVLPLVFVLSTSISGAAEPKDSLDNSVPTTTPQKRRAFNHNGEGGTDSPLPPVTAAPIVTYHGLTTPSNRFIGAIRKMQERQGAGRLDACSSPMISDSEVRGPFARVDIKKHLFKEVTRLLECGTRVGGSGSDGYKCAFEYIKSRVRCDNIKDTSAALPQWWRAAIEGFEHIKTVVGDKNFNNFIAEFDGGDEARYGHLVLAAHWDSKHMTSDGITGKEFVAATDSAVPVVLILEIMKYVTSLAEMHRSSNEPIPLPKITVMLFDGEEAFLEWRGDDNTYGSRLQAAKWKKEGKAQGITTFMLLDLLGAQGLTLHNMFHGQTGKQYASLRNIELAFADESQEWRNWPKDIMGENTLQYEGPREGNRSGAKIVDTPFPYEPLGVRSQVSDDHLPWLAQNVPILHLIALPFPTVWHKLEDDNEHLQYDSIYELLRVFAEYVLTYTKAGATTQRAK